jgi:GxxExxY protein
METEPSTMARRDIMELCNLVRQTAYEIHVYHGHGHLEKVYENALSNRLRKLGLDVKQQNPMTVRDEDGTVLGEYFSDLLVEGQLIVELKAAKTLADEHVAQLLGYLKSSRVEHGVLINFGSYRFQMKKFVLSDASLPRTPVSRITACLFSFFSLYAIYAFFRGQ